MPVRGIRLPQDQHDFNQAVSAVRVANEHTIGILKNRFQVLKTLPIRVTEENVSIVCVVDYIEACCVLHNILLDLSVDENDMEWYDVGDQENNNNVGIVVENDNNVGIVVNEENNKIVNNEIGDGNDNQDDMMDDDNNNKNLVVDGWVGQQLGEQLRTYVKQYREDLIALQQQQEQEQQQHGEHDEE
jgi:hypothetical protein